MKLGDYKVPAKSMNTMLPYEYAHNPSLFNSTKLGRDQKAAEARGISQTTSTAKGNAFQQMTLSRAGETVAKNVNPVSHWKAISKAVNEKTTEGERIKSVRPMWSINRQAYSSSRGMYTTEFMDSMGKHGHNPRNILNADSEKAENKLNELSVGTTKVTRHVPGYNGFIPQTDYNPKCLEQANLNKDRDTIIKQNIVENYSVKVPGYSGHKPMSVFNDRGSVRPSCLSTAGEAFN